jgi:hypothetical protein
MNLFCSLFLLLAVPHAPVSGRTGSELDDGRSDLVAAVKYDEAELFIATGDGDIDRRLEDTCGDGDGKSCGSWFSSFTCPGTCCHDDFNTWCCPPSMHGSTWQCHGNYKDPGSNQHCDVKTSCRCSSQPHVIAMTPSGQPDITRLTNLYSTFCCSGVNCEVQSTASFQETQSINWSKTLSFGESITFSEGDPEVEGVSIGLTFGQSYTNGKVSSNTTTLSDQISCSNVYSPSTPQEMYYSACQTIKYKQAYDVTISHCNEQSNTTISIEGQQVTNKCACTKIPCSNFLDTHTCLDWFQTDYTCPLSASTVTLTTKTEDMVSARRLTSSLSDCHNRAGTALEWAEKHAKLPEHAQDIQNSYIDHVEYNSDNGSCTSTAKVVLLTRGLKDGEAKPTKDYLESERESLESDLKEYNGARLSSVAIHEATEVYNEDNASTKKSKKSTKRARI